MTPTNLAKRLERIEAARRPAGRLCVCRCATANGRENLPRGEHLPDCPAAAAGPADRVIVVTYAPTA